MKVYGQLEYAQVHNLGSLPSPGIKGKLIHLTTDDRMYEDDGTVIRAILKNDSKLVIGNSGTANDNSRLHRGAAGVIQLVKGSDVTAEGTLSTNLNQLSFRAENYTDSGKPAVGNAGRLIYVTDLQTMLVDTGTTWNALGGGGGGGSLKWVEDANAPVPTVENLVQTYFYSQGNGQNLYALIRVSDSYSPGRQIKMKLDFYSPDNTGTALLQTVANLIREGVDPMTSTANQRTSTNSAVALGAGTVNIPQEVLFDLTDASGQVNGVAVSKGDLLVVNLTRGTDTGVSELRALVYGAEVLLS